MKDVTKMTVDKLRDWAYEASEEELKTANKIVVDALNYLMKVRDLAEATNYRVGQEVSFRHNGRLIRGTVERVNQRTLSLHKCSDGKVWKVGYRFIEK